MIRHRDQVDAIRDSLTTYIEMESDTITSEPDALEMMIPYLDALATINPLDAYNYARAMLQELNSHLKHAE